MSSVVLTSCLEALTSRTLLANKTALNSSTVWSANQTKDTSRATGIVKERFGCLLIQNSYNSQANYREGNSFHLFIDRMLPSSLLNLRNVHLCQKIVFYNIQASIPESKQATACFEKQWVVMCYITTHSSACAVVNVPRNEDRRQEVLNLAKGIETLFTA